MKNTPTALTFGNASIIIDDLHKRRKAQEKIFRKLKVPPNFPSKTLTKWIL